MRTPTTLLLLTLGVACGPSDPDARGGFATAPPEDPGNPARWDSENVSFWDFEGAVPADAFLVDHDPTVPCVGSLDDLCGVDYWSFPDRAERWAYNEPLSRDDLLQIAEDLESVAQAPVGADPDTLARAIVDAWGTRFLLSEVDALQRPVSMTDSYRNGFHVKDFIIHDPWVGSFRLEVTFPASDGPHPAIFAMHGHGTEALDWVDVYHGLDYVGAGYVLAAIDHRMMYANEAESEVGCMLLEQGFSLLGLHAYETFVAQRLLRSLDEVDPDRIALIGHSAGSNKTNQFIHMARGFQAAITDLPSAVATFPDGDFSCHEAWVPELFPWQDNLNDFADAPVPTLVQGYGYPDGPAPVLDFLAAHL